MLECQNYEFKEDESVEFDVQADERGRPHATALKPVVGRKPTDCISALSASATCRGLGQRHRGYVRRFADRWGFLNAAAFDGDLFVHRAPRKSWKRHEAQTLQLKLCSALLSFAQLCSALLRMSTATSRRTL